MTHPEPATPLPHNNRRRWFAALAAASGLGLLGAQVQAQGWGHPDPAERARRLDWRIGRMLQEVGGTPQQKDRLVAIAAAAMADLKPLRDQMRQARRAGIDLLAATVIDRRALEQLRATQMQVADARSRRQVQAFADAADVLTPEQRLKVAEHLKQRMDRRGRG
ncbi:MAG: periplasmic heavy metal sensor [Ramlibacter sp.]